MVVAGVLGLFKNRKRPVEARMIAYRVLRAMIEGACHVGVTLIAIHTDADGIETEHNLEVKGSPFVDLSELCNDEFYQTYFASAWATAVNDATTPWVSTPGMKPHLADWLAFLLDVPQSERIPSPMRITVQAKNVYSGSALGMLTQITHSFDSELWQLSESLAADKFDKGTDWCMDL